MKDFDKFDVALVDLVTPNIGNLVTVTLEDGEVVKARIKSVTEPYATLMVVPEETKE